MFDDVPSAGMDKLLFGEILFSGKNLMMKKCMIATVLLAFSMSAGYALANETVASADASQTSQADTSVHRVRAKDGSFTGEIVGTPAAAGKFAKLEIGMSRRQVEDLIGPPSDQKEYATGKAWIPFMGIFSRDKYRIATYYKHEGTLVYAHEGTKLFKITVNSDASGYQ